MSISGTESMLRASAAPGSSPSVAFAAPAVAAAVVLAAFVVAADFFVFGCFSSVDGAGGDDGVGSAGCC